MKWCRVVWFLLLLFSILSCLSFFSLPGFLVLFVFCFFFSLFIWCEYSSNLVSILISLYCIQRNKTLLIHNHILVFWEGGKWVVSLCIRSFAPLTHSFIHSFSMSQKKTTWNESEKRKFAFCNNIIFRYLSCLYIFCITVWNLKEMYANPNMYASL